MHDQKMEKQRIFLYFQTCPADMSSSNAWVNLHSPKFPGLLNLILSFPGGDNMF